MTSLAGIRLIEETSMNALPALQTILYDGWILRFAKGYTRRANSVNPIYQSNIEISQKIAACETIYRERKQRIVFKITGAALPKKLDSILERMGYETDTPVSVQVCELPQLGKEPDVAVTRSGCMTDEWIHAFARMNNLQETSMTALQSMLAMLHERHCYFSIERGAEIVSTGLAVIGGEWAGLFDIVTDSRHRRMGLGMTLTREMLRWAKENDAKKSYLQVLETNRPAIALYEQLGFREAYKYWYRMKD
jgi:GNAT superfamily N-acetyltransferase